MAVLLMVVILAEVIAIVALLASQVRHVLRHRHRQLRQPMVDEARRAVVAAVASDQATGSTVRALNELSPGDRDDVLCDVAASVRSHQDPMFQELASLVGTADRIESGLRSRRWWRRLAALQRLAVLGLPNPRAVALLDDPDPRVRALAAQWAALVDPTGLTAERLSRLLGDQSDRVRHRASVALFGLGPVAHDAVRLALGSGDATRRRSAIALAATIGDPGLASAVWPLIDEPDPGLRADAIRAVAPLLGDQHIDMVEELLDSPHRGVRGAAAEVVGSAGLLGLAGPVANRILNDPSAEVREAAIAALGQLGSSGELLLRHCARYGWRVT